MIEPSRLVRDVWQAMSIKYNNLVYEMKQRGEDIVVLSLGEAFFDFPIWSFDELPHPSIHHYSHSRGIIQLRRNIATYFADQYDFRFNPETNIILTSGSKAAIYMALLSILNPEDEVIIYEPAWVSYTEMVKLCHGKPVTVPYYETIYHFEKYITPRTKCIILNNPNNPVGKVFPDEELKFLLRLAQKNSFFLLSDEAYSDFLMEDEKFISLGTLDKDLANSIVCNSVSKNYGISGWRIGYVIAHQILINEILKVQQHIITCPATILEYYLAKYFFELIKITKPQIFEVVKKRQKIGEFMKKIGLEFIPGTATFYFFVSILPSKLASEEFCTRLLLEDHVSTVPGLGYGQSCDHFIRVSIGTEPWDRTIRGIECIKNLIDKTC
jgi:aspartate aminotransferase/aminotransferase